MAVVVFRNWHVSQPDYQRTACQRAKTLKTWVPTSPLGLLTKIQFGGTELSTYLPATQRCPPLASSVLLSCLHSDHSDYPHCLMSMHLMNPFRRRHVSFFQSNRIRYSHHSHTFHDEWMWIRRLPFSVTSSAHLSIFNPVLADACTG